MMKGFTPFPAARCLCIGLAELLIAKVPPSARLQLDAMATAKHLAER